MADSRVLFVLLENAAGYALFEVVAFEEIGAALVDEAQDAVTDRARFSRAVKLTAFMPFGTAAEALDNANAISEHAMSPTLHNFLEMNLPQSKKKSGTKVAAFSLGLIDPGLATAVAEGLSVSCRSDDTVKEIVRGCRLHLEHYVGGLGGGASVKAQLGLGHSYSRSKVKFNPARADNMIIQSIALLDQLDKDVNTFAMRVREWYSWHFPELRDIVKDNIMFARAAGLIQNKSSLFADSQKAATAAVGEHTGQEDPQVAAQLAALTDIVGGDVDMAHAIVAAARTSMGMDCSAIDMLNIVNFSERMVKLAEYRKQLSGYLSDKMSTVAPNLSALIGDTVAARLISKAGSLTNLAKAPASTVQILGAEKALFRALKTKGNTPKYGLIYHSTFIGRAEAKNKGRISRYLANKCSIATRIDSFADGTPSRLYGEKLRDQVEERLRFYETGQAPRRNLQVMEEVSRELKAGRPDAAMEVDALSPSSSKKDKKKKDKKKDKKKRKADDDDEKLAADPEPAPPAKKAKIDDDGNGGQEVDKSAKKKKKKKSKSKD